MVTHQELNILECEVKWASGSIVRNKFNGGDGIPVDLFPLPGLELRGMCYSSSQWAVLTLACHLANPIRVVQMGH